LIGGDSDKDGEDNSGVSGYVGTSIFNNIGYGAGSATFLGFLAAITAIIVLPHMKSVTIKSLKNSPGSFY